MSISRLEAGLSGLAVIGALGAVELGLRQFTTEETVCVNDFTAETRVHDDSSWDEEKQEWVSSGTSSTVDHFMISDAGESYVTNRTHKHRNVDGHTVVLKEGECYNLEVSRTLWPLLEQRVASASELKVSEY